MKAQEPETGFGSAAEFSAVFGGIKGGAMAGCVDHKSKYIATQELLEEVAGLMEDLCQSGFDTVHDSTLAGIEKAAQQTGQYGMERLSKLLEAFYKEIALGRHQMERNRAKLAEEYTLIWEYLHLCRQKAAYDRGLAYYTEESEDEKLV